nr:hypothetical protein [Tanacetum cinerariifolium]
ENSESDDDKENVDEEEYDDLYKDVDMKALKDAHVTLTASQKTDGLKQSSSVSFDFANQFLILEKAPPSEHEVASLMKINMSHEVPSTQIHSLLTEPVTVIPDSSTIVATTVPPTISMIIPLPQLTTPSPAPTTTLTTTSIPALLDFSSMFGFDQRSDTQEFKKKAQEERKFYIDVIKKSVKDIIKDEVRSQFPQILPKEVLDFTTPVIQNTITKSLENIFLAKSSSQPKSTYEAAENAYSLKRDRKDEDKDEDPPTGSNQGLKKQKTSKDAEPSKGSKSKESKSSSSSKDTKSQPKSSGKSTQAEEPVFEAADSEMQHDQWNEFGHTDDQPDDEAASKHDWFKKPDKPLTPDRAWNTIKSINVRPPQTWINNIAKAREPPRTFDELMSTSIDFLAYVLNHLKINNLTQEILAMEPLPLIEVQGRQVVHADYFFNNDLKYLKGRSPSRKYKTSTTKTKAAKYDNIEGIEDMVLMLWSPVKVAYDKYAIWGISH